MTIWKYAIETTDTQFIRMPAGAKILCCQIQAGEVNIWVLVDPEAEELHELCIRIFGTGHQIHQSQNLYYVGSYQLRGALVFHVFQDLISTRVPK